MITCELGKKKYSVDFVSGRTLRNLPKVQEALIAYQKSAEEGAHDYGEHLDAMVSWFANDLFKGQFTVDDVYDLYPVDKLCGDIALAVASVRFGITEKLNSYPIPAALVKQMTDAMTTVADDA